MDKKFAIFDMDGTLIDSMPLWQGLAGEYLASKGLTEVPPNLLREIEAMTMSESAALFACRFPRLGSAKQVEGEMNARMEAHYRQDIPLKPGVLAHLQALRAQGTALCVASATAAPLMEDCLGRLGIRQYFRFLLSCEEMRTSKRSPEIYLEAARRLDAAPEEMAVYEDALYAAKTAGDAGFYVVGVWEETLAGDWDRLCAVAQETIRF